MTRLSSADPGDDEQQSGGAGAPPAEEITDPELAAEVDNPADSNAPTGAAAAPGGDTTAADDAPVPAPGAPGELSSDQTPAQGEERGVAAPSSPMAGEPAGGAAGAEADPGGDRPATATAPAPLPGDGSDEVAVVPEQPPSTPVAAAEGASVERAVADKAAVADEAADVADKAAAPPAPADEESSPAEVDEARQRLIDTLRRSLGDAVVGSHVLPGTDAWVRVTVDAWRQAAEVCRDELGLTYFCYLSAIDWLPSPYGRSEDAPDDADADADGTGDDAGAVPDAPTELEHGYAGGETRFQLLARYVSPTTFVGLTLKADLDDDAPSAPTVSEVYAGADWHEREAWEMYGIDFEGHPNLVHLYLPGAFEGHPQRKDFPLLAREVKPWPGLVDVEAMPGEVAGDGEAS